jgi:hypothetical protein
MDVNIKIDQKSCLHNRAALLIRGMESWFWALLIFIRRKQPIFCQKGRCQHDGIQ